MPGWEGAGDTCPKGVPNSCIPHGLPVVADGGCLVALVSQVFANIVVNLETDKNVVGARAKAQLGSTLASKPS